MTGWTAFSAFLRVTALAAALSACGTGDPESAEQSSPLQIEVPEAAIGDPARFNADFDRSFKDSCTTAASEAGAPPPMAQAVCDCGVSQLNDRYSAIEKARLTTDQLDAVMRLCADKVLKTNG